MKRFLTSIVFVCGLAQSSYADIQEQARHIIPSSEGFNKAIASMVGTSEVKVNDFANVYALPISQWLLYKLFAQNTHLNPTYKRHLSAFFHVEELLYLVGITYLYAAEAWRTSNNAQLVASGLNAVAGVVFIKRLHDRYWW